MLTANRIMAAVMVAVGLAILVETVAVGGGQVGFLIGAALLVLGVLRWRAARSRP